MSRTVDNQQRRLEEEKDQERQKEIAAPKLPHDTPQLIRVKQIFDRLVASAGLQNLPWSLDVEADGGQ
jgi:hypothetical protein